MATHSSIPAWEIHGQRNLAGYSPQGRKESDPTEATQHSFSTHNILLYVYTTFSLSIHQFLSIYSWLHWVFVAVCRLSLVAASGGYSLVAVCGLLTVVVSLVEEHRLQCSCLQQSWCTGLLTPQHLASSQTRDRTCIGRWTLNHWTTREVLSIHQLMDI